jgi:hypothetical protein
MWKTTTMMILSRDTFLTNFPKHWTLYNCGMVEQPVSKAFVMGCEKEGNRGGE